MAESGRFFEYMIWLCPTSSSPVTFRILNSPDATSDWIESARATPTPIFWRTAALIPVGPSQYNRNETSQKPERTHANAQKGSK